LKTNPFIFLAIVLLLLLQPAFAQEINPYVGETPARSAEAIDLFYDTHIDVQLEKTVFSPGETLKGRIVILNLEPFPVAEAYLVLEVVQGSKYYYPSQTNDRDNVFIEKKIHNINLSPSERHELDFSIALPPDLAAGSYRLDVYAKAEKPLMFGVPHLFSTPRTVLFGIDAGQGEFPGAKIVRTKTRFHNFLGPIGPELGPGAEISNNIFILNTSTKEFRDLRLFVGLCEWDDTACTEYDSQDEARIDSLAAGEEKSVSVKLKAPLQPDAYAIRIELRDSENRLVSLYRNRVIVSGPTAKIHKLHVSDFLFVAGGKGSITMLVGPSPDHYKKPAFREFDLKVSIEDLVSGKNVFSTSERIEEIGHTRKFDIDFVERVFSFTAPSQLDFFRVCGSIEKALVVHELYCFVVDAQKFKAKKNYSDIGVAWNYSADNRKLDIIFSLLDESVLRDVDATFSLNEFSANSLVGEGELSAPLPKTASFSALGIGSYTLVLNNFLTKKQSRFDIDLGLPPLPAEGARACSEQGGFACRENESCTGSLLPARDAVACCSIQCRAKPGVEMITLLPPETSLLPLAALILILVLVYLLKKNKKMERFGHG